MKVRWDFYFETSDFKFGRVHKYRGEITDVHAAAFGVSSQGEFLLTFEPDAECKFPPAEQSGMLRLLLPGRQEETEKLALWLVHNVAEQISFHHGHLKVHGGLVTGEHLPETPEEEEELGEGRYFANAHLEEVLPTPTFEGGSLRIVTGDPEINQAMRQHNAALRSVNPVDRYLGLFRVLEDLLASESKNRKLAAALKASRTLYDVGYAELTKAVGDSRRQLTRDEFNALVDQLVEVRDHCAHLRTKQGLGIPHGDPRVSSEIEPLLEPLRTLCYGVVQQKLLAHPAEAPGANDVSG